MTRAADAAAGAGRVLPPPRLVPAYFLLGYASLVLAFAVVALDPGTLLGSILAPRALAAVHFVTLCWITPAILGASYTVLPLALKVPFAADPSDPWLCAAYWIGATGIASHMWLAEYSGLVWSAVMVVGAAAPVAVRIFRAARRSSCPAPVRWAILLAWANLLVAAVLGSVVAADHGGGLLGEHKIAVLFAHVHAAAVGFALTMAVGVGHRLLPMVLPAGPRPARSAALAVGLVQGGLLGVWTGLLWWPGAVRWAAIAVAAGLLLFVADVTAMLRDRRPPPRALPRPDLGTSCAVVAVAWIGVAAALGVFLAWAPRAESRWLFAYGVAGLVGGLAQLAVGISLRLLPIHVWTARWAGEGYRELPVPAPAMGSVALRAVTALGWLPGSPALALGVWLQRPALIGIGAWALALGSAAAFAHAVTVLRRPPRRA